ncbi:hypothetical protein [Thermoflavimicrobium daqui]|uniref:Integral membrane protein n=1 Tax=Thermoflavimicrobium daqui TaxID=2137476 RepID=A0A364K9J2_9BACL|nr:hypothetical protein [Thermoflavimicrobium daqui]RAL26948.1 hypothetical protein DL897_02580 [Thermoflavimicrobium daqui]
MFEFFSNYRFAFLIGAEVTFWILITSFFALRYLFRFEKASILAIPLILANELFIAFLGYIDYKITGQFSRFQIIVIIILIYSLTYGKKDFKRLDHFIKRKIAKWRGEPIPSELEEVKLYGWAHTKSELKQWCIHLLVYITVHIIFIFTFGLNTEVLHDLSSALEKGQLFKNESITSLSYVWSIIFVIDTIITLSYVISPKKKKA